MQLSLVLWYTTSYFVWEILYRRIACRIYCFLYKYIYIHNTKAWEKRREQKIDWNTSCLPLQCDMHDFGINIFCVWVVSMLVLNHGSDDNNNGGFEVFYIFFFSFSCFIAIEIHCFVICAVQEMKSQDFLYRNWKKFLTIKTALVIHLMTKQV